MSMCVLGMSEEFKEIGIAVNALWPRTGIATAAINLIAGHEQQEACRTPEIMVSFSVSYRVLSRLPYRASSSLYQVVFCFSFSTFLPLYRVLSCLLSNLLGFLIECFPVSLTTPSRLLRVFSSLPYCTLTKTSLFPYKHFPKNKIL